MKKRVHIAKNPIKTIFRRSKRVGVDTLLIPSVIFLSAMITTTIAHAEKVCVERAELESAAADFDGLKKDLNKCIDEADKIKSQRDQCSGKLDAQDVRIRTLEIEKMGLITNVSLLKSDASSRWSWYIWLTIGAIIPPAAYITFTLVDD